jgi:selenocysteine lyase/cysteine desulfurase
VSFEEMAALVREHEVGRRACLESPYGRRLVTYADLTATGRYLHFVEAWLRRVRPFYANSHTAISSTGRVMTELREEARRVIRRALNAGPTDEVLFVGSGATAAVNKLVGLLGWRISEPLERAYGLSKAIPREERPVVFVGPYEHHSNELPWLESIAEVVEIGLCPRGQIDLEDLERKLERFASRAVKVGSFSAASNVTGVVSDVAGLARVLHRHGALACFDFAAGGPYLPIDMHPADEGARIDALYLSTHKFIGGPEGSGLLVASRDFFRTRSPERPGGGTVDYVASFDSMHVDYVGRLDEREEGGTPAIMGDIRAGIGFLVKEMAGPARILEHELELARMALARLSRHPQARVVGAQRRAALADHQLQHQAAAPRLRLSVTRPLVWHSESGRLLVRGAVRAPAAGHRAQPQRRLPGADCSGLGRPQARLGARVAAVLRERRRHRVHSLGYRVRR